MHICVVAEIMEGEFSPQKQRVKWRRAAKNRASYILPKTRLQHKKAN